MRKLCHGSLWDFYVSFGEVSRMQDYFKSILVVEWPHFRKKVSPRQELLTFNFFQRWPYQLMFK